MLTRSRLFCTPPEADKLKLAGAGVRVLKVPLRQTSPLVVLLASTIVTGDEQLLTRLTRAVRAGPVMGIGAAGERKRVNNQVFDYVLRWYNDLNLSK